MCVCRRMGGGSTHIPHGRVGVIEGGCMGWRALGGKHEANTHNNESSLVPMTVVLVTKHNFSEDVCSTDTQLCQHQRRFCGVSSNYPHPVYVHCRPNG